MKKIRFRLMMLVMLVPLAMLWGCGGGGGSSSPPPPAKAAVSGTVSFPALSVLVTKRLSAVTPPALTITDLSGNLIATVTLTVDPNDSNRFTYTVSLDPKKNYVFKATRSGQVIKSIADQSTLNPLTAVVDLTPVTTAAVLVVESKLGLAAGALGTTAATTADLTQLSQINPTAVVNAISDAVTNGGSTQLTNLVDAVTTALHAASDPATVTTVQSTISTAAAVYTPPPVFTTAMVSGRAGRTGSGTIYGFNTNGTFVSNENTRNNIWILNPDGTLLLTYLDLGTNQVAWDRVSLVANNTGTLSVSVLHSGDTTQDSDTFTYLSSITVSSDLSSQFVGGAQQFRAAGVFANTSSASLTTLVTWSSSNTSQATVSSAGMVTAVAAGSPKIRATLASVFGEATLTVMVPQQSAIQTALQAGLYSINSDHYGTTNQLTAYTYERIGISGSAMSKSISYYNSANATWGATAPTGYSRNSGYVLGASQWVQNVDGPSGYGIAYNTDGTATLTNPASGDQMHLELSTTDISGLSIASGFASDYQQWKFTDGQTAFPTGSIRYDAALTPLNDSYEVQGQYGPITSLTSIPTTVTKIYMDSNSRATDYYCVPDTTGNSVTIYSEPSGGGSPTTIGTATWTISLVHGQQIAEILIPFELRGQYKLGGNPIVTVIGGYAWVGRHSIANQIDNSSGATLLNTTAFNYLKSQFSLGAGSVTASW